MPPRFRFAALLAALALPVLAGCEATNPTPETANLRLLVDGVVGAAAYAPGTTYTVDGRAVTFTDARLYLSNLRLVRADGSEYVVPAGTPTTLPAYDDGGTEVSHTVNETVAYLPLDLGRYEGALAEAPAGTYTGLRFDVGLTGQTNRVNPVLAPAGHALAKRTDFNNHWSWNVGYIFSRTEGMVDLDADGTAETPWMMHLGTAGYVVPVSVTADTPFTIEPGTTPGLHFQVDLAQIISGLDLSDPAQRGCMTMGCSSVADAVRAALPDAFHFHGVHAD